MVPDGSGMTEKGRILLIILPFLLLKEHYNSRWFFPLWEVFKKICRHSAAKSFKNCCDLNSFCVIRAHPSKYLVGKYQKIRTSKKNFLSHVIHPFIRGHELKAIWFCIDWSKNIYSFSIFFWNFFYWAPEYPKKFLIKIICQYGFCGPTSIILFNVHKS